MSHQFDKFKLSDHFAQISSILLTKRAHSGYTIPELKEILTTSDPVQLRSDGNRKRIEVETNGFWSADVPVWDLNVIEIVRRSLTVRQIVDSDVCMAIDSFAVKYHPNARGIRRKSPRFPEPESGQMEFPLNRTNGLNGDGTPILNLITGSSSAEDSTESALQDLDCYAQSAMLEVVGGPDLMKFPKIKSSQSTSEIFKVPRRKQNQHTPSGSGVLNAFTPYQDAPELIPSVINQVDGSKEGDKSRLEPIDSTGDVVAESPLIGRREQANDVASPSEVEDIEVQERLVRVVLHEGKNYLEYALMIANVTFVVVLIVTCMAIGCLIIEQRQKKRVQAEGRRSKSSSKSPTFPRSSYISPPTRRRNSIATRSR